MKKILGTLLVLGFTANSFAQVENVSKATFSKNESSKTGIYVGLAYMNISEFKLEYTFTAKNGGRKFSDTSTQGTHLGTAGIAIGYERTPDYGLGFSAGVQMMESFNRSEYGSTKLYIVMPEVNLTVAANSMFMAYGGGNAAIWSGSSAANRYTPDIGGQLGVGLRFNRDIAIKAGYTIMSLTLKDTDENADQDAKVLASGFNSSLLYTF